MISDSYRAQLTYMHTHDNHFGMSGSKNLHMIKTLAEDFKTTDILDYGCGKSMLAREIGFEIKQYDPAIAKYAAAPEPADMVVCSDVLEHCEVEHIDAVLDDLKRVTKKVAYMLIATREAKKLLPDGRNSHLIVESARWWLDKLWDRFEIVEFMSVPEEEFWVVVGPKS